MDERNVDRGSTKKNKLGGGPRTAAGKRRSRDNARKHGLSVPVTADRYIKNAVVKLARGIAGEGANDDVLQQALVVAECELTLRQICRACLAAIEGALALQDQTEKSEDCRTADAFAEALPDLQKIERYERRTFSRRNRALQNLKCLQVLACLKP